MNRHDRRASEARQRKRFKMTAIRTCGTCSLCCKLVGVDALDKPEDAWCPHVCPGQGGCSIYADRPASCRNFICAWLSGAPDFGDEWFPARCKMVLAPRLWEKARSVSECIRKSGIFVRVDPDYPDAWRCDPYHSQLLTWARTILVLIRVGGRVFVLHADGTEQDLLAMARTGSIPLSE